MVKTTREEKVSMWVFYDSWKSDYKCYSGNERNYLAEAELPEYVLGKWFSGERYELVGCYNIRKSKVGIFEKKVNKLDGESRTNVKGCLDTLRRNFS